MKERPAAARGEPVAASSREPVPAPRGGAPAPQRGEPGAQGGFLPPEPTRPRAESILVRLVATAGVVGVATAVGAVMGAQDVAAWIIALVVSLISVTLAAVLWRSRLL